MLRQMAPWNEHVATHCDLAFRLRHDHQWAATFNAALGGLSSKDVDRGRVHTATKLADYAFGTKTIGPWEAK